MRPVKFTDAHRFTMPYANAEETRKPGYLARRFQRIRAEQSAILEEAKAKMQILPAAHPEMERCGGVNATVRGIRRTR